MQSLPLYNLVLLYSYLMKKVIVLCISHPQGEMEQDRSIIIAFYYVVRLRVKYVNFPQSPVKAWMGKLGK